MGGYLSSFASKLLFLIIVSVAGLLLLGVVWALAMDRVQINGKLYRQIVDDQDVIAALNPQSLNLQAAYVALYQAANEPDAARRGDLLATYRREGLEFPQRYSTVARKAPEGSDLTNALQAVRDTGAEFFDTANRDVVPVLQAADGAAANPKVAGVLNVRLREIYERQQRGVGSAVEKARAAKQSAEATAQNTMTTWNWILVAVNLLVAGAIIAAGYWIATGITRPTNELIARMRDMASGSADLTARVTVRGNDEIAQLGTAINTVIGRIHDLVTRIRESSLQLYTSSTEIAATAREQESTMQTLGASTNQIAAATKQITATSQQLAHTMNSVSSGGAETGRLASAGRTGLAGMGDTMRRLAESTNSISSKLGVVREKANDINVVVTTITKVADQTNLLSINAAIEAEKAGEYGRGVLVVAREIRRLADQTAVATLDIENMVRQMQAAVSAGVMEMDKFTEEVRAGVAKVSEVNTQMGQIIEQVQALNHGFQTANEGMTQQTAGAQQINDAMLQLAAGVQQSTASLKEFHQVTMTLRESADALKQLVARFTVAA